MIILTTTLLFHITAKHGAMWEGIGAAWILAAFMDASLYAWLIYCIFKPKLG